MRSKTLVLALTVSLGRLAAAQPGPPAPPLPPVDSTTGTTVPTEPVAPPRSEPPPPPHVVERPVEPVEPVRDDVRPGELSFAIGIGYTFPDSLETPNTTSVRIRLPTGLTFEPRVTIQNTTTDMGGSETTDSVLLLATAVKYPFIRHGRTDLELIGTAGLGSRKHDPDGPSNTNTTTTFELGWGVGIGYWLNRHWQLSLDAENPLIEHTATTMQSVTGDQKTSSTAIGLVFDPTVLLMIHLYN